MGHIKDHKEFRSSVFRAICDDCLKDLPEAAKDANASWEARAENALEHLLNKVVTFCGVESGFVYIGEEAKKRLPRYAQLAYTIIDIVDFDSIHYHAGFYFFWKEPIIRDYLNRAGIGDRPE
ncbi:MAG TPA: hypothetical protein VN843_07190 [Anaerolineales bacterium]|nr:hypothetical protein [Anaerolineales bacterium]